jgi:integrase
LTTGYLKNLKSDRNLQISDAAVPGLQFRYSAATDRKVFYLQYRVRGTKRQRHMRLGTFVEFSLTDIRAKAVSMKKDIFAGTDPQVVQCDRVRETLAREARRKKLKELTPIFMEKHCRENNREGTYRANESLMRIHINPILGDKCIEDIDLAMIQDAYDKIKNNKTVAAADHVLRLLSTFLNWCEKYNHRQINSNPCRLVQKAKYQKFKYQVLDLNGYKRLFSALDDALDIGNYSAQTILAVKAIALTGCRSGEITNLEHDELDLENGYLRLNKRKTDAFNVPLGEPAIDVIKQALKICKSKRYVFHSPIDHTKPLVDMRRVFWWALDRADLPRMRVHDLRHSFASLATDMGEDIRVLKDVLGHTKITTTEIYAHTSNKAARRTAGNVANAIVG